MNLVVQGYPTRAFDRLESGMNDDKATLTQFELVELMVSDIGTNAEAFRKHTKDFESILEGIKQRPIASNSIKTQIIRKQTLRILNNLLRTDGTDLAIQAGLTQALLELRFMEYLIDISDHHSGLIALAELEEGLNHFLAIAPDFKIYSFEEYLENPSLLFKQIAHFEKLIPIFHSQMELLNEEEKEELVQIMNTLEDALLNAQILKHKLEVVFTQSEEISERVGKAYQSFKRFLNLLVS